MGWGHGVGMSLQVKISYYDREGRELAVAWLYLTCVGRCPPKLQEFVVSWDLAGSTRQNSLGATGHSSGCSPMLMSKREIIKT